MNGEDTEADDYSEGSTGYDLEARFRHGKKNEDDDFDYDESTNSPRDESSLMASTDGKIVMNNHFDEEHEVEGVSIDGSIATPVISPKKDSEENSPIVAMKPSNEPAAQPPGVGSSRPGSHKIAGMTTLTLPQRTVDSSEESEDGSEQDDDDDLNTPKIPEYNAAEYASLPVTNEIRDLFSFIVGYKPHNIELETKLKPFIPEHIPAAGDMDPFLKVPRPDKQPDYLGLKVLDEPALAQADPTVVQLKLVYLSKDVKTRPVKVKTIENAEKNPKAIRNWITNINNLHKSKPPQSVIYSRPMPDIEDLMQVWPEEFEELLQSVELPSADADLSVEEYARLICTLLDIPVYNNIIESLHVLFTLYSEFKTNQHFNQNGL